MRKDVARRLPFVALVFALSACGGGGGSGDGVGSTPPPPTTGPTPPTTPTPPPTGSNSSLATPLLSETFVNRNAEVALTADVSAGTGTSTVTQRALNLSYDAATGSYTLSANGRTLVFGPADLDASKSTGTLAVYTKGSSNSASDTLTLTKYGTSGRFTYRYVGAAFWERSSLTGNTLTASAQSSVYGAVTPNAAVPRTGAASYAVDLIGYVTMQSNPIGITGSGRMDVDFARGQLVTSGTIPMSPTSGFSGSFRSAATLSSNANSFAGSFNIDGFDSYSGTIDGLFFGPAADEVGAAWIATQGPTSNAAGVILGRRDGAPGNASFNAVTNNDFFYPTTARLDYRQPSSAPPQNGTVADGQLTIQYNAATGSYTLIAPDRTTIFTGLGANAVNGTASGTGANNIDRLSVYGNYSHVRLGLWSSSANVPQSSNSDVRLQRFIFGMPTATTAVPRTGEGAFAIEVGGSAADADYPNRMDFGGNGVMRVNFGTGALTLTSPIDYREDWFLSGRAAMLADGQLTGSGTLSSSANAFNGSLTLTGVGNYSGAFAGQLFGPTGQEVGATFKATDGSGGAANGTIIGKRDDSLLVVVPDKTLVTQAEPFSVAVEGLRDGQASQLNFTWDPQAGTFRVNNKAFDTSVNAYDVTLGTKLASSDASFNRYDVSADGIRTQANFLVPGAGNPTLALTYSSFAELRQDVDASNYRYPTRTFFHYGHKTLATSMPKSGQATYNGVVLGAGYLNGGVNQLDVTGTSLFTIDFASSQVNAALTLSSRPGGSSDPLTALGTFNYLGTRNLEGFFVTSISAPGMESFSGTMRGIFYGAAAAELGANWTITARTNAGNALDLYGVTVAKKK